MPSLQPNEDDIRKVWFSAGKAYKTLRNTVVLGVGEIGTAYAALGVTPLSLFMQATRDPSVYVALAVVNLIVAALAASGSTKKPPTNNL
jgi:hypothetical protein